MKKDTVLQGTMIVTEATGTETIEETVIVTVMETEIATVATGGNAATEVDESTTTMTPGGVMMMTEDTRGEGGTMMVLLVTGMSHLGRGAVVVVVVVVVEEAVTVHLQEEVAEVTVMAHLAGDLLLPKDALLYPRERGKRLVGTSMPQAMNSIALCKRSKLVCPLTILLPSVLKSSPGLFNLPGANRTQIPPILGIAGLPPPLPVPTFGMGLGANPNLSRQSRRLYIGSITPDVNENNLADFFNAKMNEMNIGTGGPGNPVLAVQCNYEKNYAFIEVGRTPILSSNADFFAVPQRRRRHGCDGFRWNHFHQRTSQNSSPQGLCWRHCCATRRPSSWCRFY